MDRLCAAVVLGVFLSAPVQALANARSDALRARAADEIYNLDRDRAVESYREAVQADPQDAAAYRGLASALWLSITFRRGNMTVDDFLGRIARPGQLAAPNPEAAAAFNNAVDKAISLARQRVEANPKDADAHYQLGAAVAVRASYMATVEGSVWGAFRTAREAYTEHETVMELDPQRKDGALIVGTYRYVVSTLSLPPRWVAYMAGFGGGKERGLRLVEEAAAYPGENQTDARFALVLLYNREKRYDDALKQLAILRAQYPRNRLAWLESGATSLRASQAAYANKFLEDGMARFAEDPRLRMPGEDALWFYKRGTARAALGRTDEATQDLRKALTLQCRDWVQGRTHLELGKLALKAGDRAAATRELQAAISLCDGDNDAASAEEARRLLK
jgi:tetratricopeptide (TPR) repeat protein